MASNDCVERAAAAPRYTPLPFGRLVKHRRILPQAANGCFLASIQMRSSLRHPTSRLDRFLPTLRGWAGAVIEMLWTMRVALFHRLAERERMP